MRRAEVPGLGRGAVMGLALASRCGGVRSLRPGGVYGGAGFLADHGEIRREVDPTHDAGFFLETARQRSPPDRR